MPASRLTVLEQSVGIGYPDPETAKLLEIAYGPLLGGEGPLDFEFEVEAAVEGGDGAPVRVVSRSGAKSFATSDDGEFLVELEAELTIELQKRRPDLFFVHSAVLERNGSAVMLAGQPGSGKSTTCWALLHRGFRYLSDELGPVEVGSLAVHPYPRSVVLKADPPGPFQVPAGALRTSRTIQIPVSLLPSPPVTSPTELATVVFLDFRGPGVEPSIEQVHTARAAAILYTHALNALAHPGEGLDAALRIAERCQCYALASSQLEASCELIERVSS